MSKLENLLWWSRFLMFYSGTLIFVFSFLPYIMCLWGRLKNRLAKKWCIKNNKDNDNNSKLYAIMKINHISKNQKIFQRSIFFMNKHCLERIFGQITLLLSENMKANEMAIKKLCMHKGKYSRTKNIIQYSFLFYLVSYCRNTLFKSNG